MDLTDALDSPNRRKQFLDCLNVNNYFGPVVVKIKPTPRCNLKCKKCNYWRIKDDSELSTDTVLDLIKEIKVLGCKEVRFSGGEPTLRNDLPELIKYCKKSHIAVGVTTNGTLIDKGMAQELVNAGLKRIAISIDSANPRVHDFLCSVNGAWEKSVKAVENIKLAKENKHKKTKITLQSVICKQNYREAREFIKFAAELKVDKVNFMALNPLTADKDIVMNKKEVVEFYGSNKSLVALAQKKGVDLNTTNPFNIGLERVYEKTPCYAPWYCLIVYFDGTVKACCYRPEVLGIYPKEKIKDILEKSVFKKLRASCLPPIHNKHCLNCYDEVKDNLYINEFIQKNIF